MSELSENEIRPRHLMVKQRLAALAEVGRMLSKCNEFVDVACPACGEDDSSNLFGKNGISYEKGDGCDTFYVNPRPTPEILDWF